MSSYDYRKVQANVGVKLTEGNNKFSYVQSVQSDVALVKFTEI